MKPLRLTRTIKIYILHYAPHYPNKLFINCSDLLLDNLYLHADELRNCGGTLSLKHEALLSFQRLRWRDFITDNLRRVVSTSLERHHIFELSRSRGTAYSILSRVSSR